MFYWMTAQSGVPDIAPYLTGAGGGFSAAASLLAGRQSAALLRTNASISGLQAQAENEAGAQSAELYRQHLNQTLGKESAQIGAGNVTVSGSPLRALENTAQLGAQDISTIQLNAARKAWGYQTTQAGDLLRADQASATGTSNAVGGLITSGVKAYGQWAGID